MHNPTSRFAGYSESDALVSQYTYERADLVGTSQAGAGVLLGLIFRENNLVEGFELPKVFQTRSLSVGDVVVLDYDNGVVEAWCVEQAGWEPVDMAAVASSRNFGKSLLAQGVGLALHSLGHADG